MGLVRYSTGAVGWASEGLILVAQLQRWRGFRVARTYIPCGWYETDVDLGWLHVCYERAGCCRCAGVQHEVAR